MHTQNSPTPRVDRRRWITFARNLRQLEEGGQLRPKFRYIQDDPRTGQQVKKTLAATTRAEARIEAGELRAQLAGGRLATDRSLTIEALAASAIGREQGPLGGRLAPRTLELYSADLRLHSIPGLGPRMKVAEVNVADIRRLLDGVAAKHSGSKVHTVRSATSWAFRHAIRDLGAIDRNPVRDLERGDVKSARRQTEPWYGSVEEIERILGLMSDESRPIAATGFYAAARRGEALALRWEHIDFEERTLRIEGTKTAASAATVPLLAPLAKELAAHRERQARLGFDRIRPDALVFQTASGRPVSGRNVLRAFQASAQRAGLAGPGGQAIGFHDLRHSLAANAFALGLGPVEVGRLLRHANSQVTMTVYAGISGDAVAMLGDKLSALGGAS